MCVRVACAFSFPSFPRMILGSVTNLTADGTDIGDAPHDFPETIHVPSQRSVRRRLSSEPTGISLCCFDLLVYITIYVSEICSCLSNRLFRMFALRTHFPLPEPYFRPPTSSAYDFQTHTVMSILFCLGIIYLSSSSTTHTVCAVHAAGLQAPPIVPSIGTSTSNTRRRRSQPPTNSSAPGSYMLNTRLCSSIDMLLLLHLWSSFTSNLMFPHTCRHYSS